MRFLVLAFLALSSVAKSELIKISGKYYDRMTVVSKDGTSSKTVYTPIKVQKGERLAQGKGLSLVLNSINNGNQNSKANQVNQNISNEHEKTAQPTLSKSTNLTYQTPDDQQNMTVAPSATYIPNTFNTLSPAIQNVGSIIYAQTSAPTISKSQAEYLQSQSTAFQPKIINSMSTNASPILPAAPQTTTQTVVKPIFVPLIYTSSPPPPPATSSPAPSITKTSTTVQPTPSSSSVSTPNLTTNSAATTQTTIPVSSLPFVPPMTAFGEVDSPFAKKTASSPTVSTLDSSSNLSSDPSNSIIGKNNIVDGKYNDLIGNQNVINDGLYNTIRGDQNVIHSGSNNIIMGDGSFVSGSRNIIY